MHFDDYNLNPQFAEVNPFTLADPPRVERLKDGDPMAGALLGETPSGESAIRDCDWAARCKSEPSTLLGAGGSHAKSRAECGHVGF